MLQCFVFLCSDGNLKAKHNSCSVTPLNSVKSRAIQDASMMTRQLQDMHLVLASMMILDNTLTNGSLCFFCQLASFRLPLLHNTLYGSLGR